MLKHQFLVVFLCHGTVAVVQAHLLAHSVLPFRLGGPSAKAGQGLHNAFDALVCLFRLPECSGWQWASVPTLGGQADAVGPHAAQGKAGGGVTAQGGTQPQAALPVCI